MDIKWKYIKIFILYTLYSIPDSSFCQVPKKITSVSNGLWIGSISTWDCGICYPNTNDTVIVKHKITLNTDWTISAGSITVTTGASLIEDKDGRIMGVNGGKLINNGIVDISRIYSIGGIVENNDSMRINWALYNSTLFFNNGILAEVDSFDNEGLFKNFPGAKLTAIMFLNSDSCINNGTIRAIDCENDGVFINRRITGSINLYNAKTGIFRNDSGGTVSNSYFLNSGYFGNNTGSKINTSFDFYNGDSLLPSLNSLFYNDGFAGIGNDWYNVDSIKGGSTGQFCVSRYTNNSGVMSGTFDFCDNTPPGAPPFIDLNIGTVSPGITYCASNCKMVVSFDYSEPSCFENCDGYARATVFGGVSPYSFIWDSGETTDSIGSLCNGIYIVKVIDSSSDTVHIGKQLFTPPRKISKDSTSATCGLPNGTASVTVNNATPPFTYSWNDPASQTSSTATGLAEGIYSVTVTDDNGCVDTINMNVSAISAPDVSKNSTNATCGLPNGTATVTVNIGEPPFTYSWGNGQSSATATGLAAGAYLITVTDSIGCVEIINITISAIPDILFSISVTNASCPETADGLAVATVSGGTPPYIYLWEPGAKNTSTASDLLPGTYYFTITDSTNCIKMDTIKVGVSAGTGCDEWHIFSGITPDNDGVDDRWIIKGLHKFSPVRVFIFNNRGILVWKSDDYNNDWDGTDFNGTALPEGIYYYVVHRPDETQKGWVSILR